MTDKDLPLLDFLHFMHLPPAWWRLPWEWLYIQIFRFFVWATSSPFTVTYIIEADVKAYEGIKSFIASNLERADIASEVKDRSRCKVILKTAGRTIVECIAIKETMEKISGMKRIRLIVQAS